MEGQISDSGYEHVAKLHNCTKNQLRIPIADSDESPLPRLVTDPAPSAALRRCRFGYGSAVSGTVRRAGGRAEGRARHVGGSCAGRSPLRLTGQHGIMIARLRCGVCARA